MITGEAFAAVALEWVGTPFRVGASLRGQGCDCVGLVVGVLREVGLPCYGEMHAVRPRRPTEGFLRGIMDDCAVRVEEGAPCVGEVLLIESPDVQHLAIHTGGGYMVHSLIKYRKVAHTQTALMQGTVTRYRFDGIEYAEEGA